MSFKKITTNKQKNTPVLQVYITEVTCSILCEKKGRTLFKMLFLIVRKIKEEKRKP